jgi:hypothetical protein
MAAAGAGSISVKIYGEAENILICLVGYFSLISRNIIAAQRMTARSSKYRMLYKYGMPMTRAAGRYLNSVLTAI